MAKSIKDYLSRLFWSVSDTTRRNAPVEDSARMLEMDEPMAGAGAQLSGMRRKSETEKALDRATARDTE